MLLRHSPLADGKAKGAAAVGQERQERGTMPRVRFEIERERERERERAN